MSINDWAAEARRARELARAAMAPQPQPQTSLEEEPVQVAKWVQPRTKQVRYYVQNVEEIIGLELELYNTGNIRSASLNGEHISNHKAGILRGVKIWYDENASIYVDRLSDKMYGIISEDDIKKSFADAVARHNELAKAGKVAPLPVLS